MGTKSPLCFHCCEKPARKLKQLPGEYGNAPMYCSMQCAAKEALGRYVSGIAIWCPVHDEWCDTYCSDCEDGEDAD